MTSLRVISLILFMFSLYSPGYPYGGLQRKHGPFNGRGHDLESFASALIDHGYWDIADALLNRLKSEPSIANRDRDWLQLRIRLEKARSSALPVHRHKLLVNVFELGSST